ncbi:hypothetical protein AB2N04_01040 (plasmid) [Nitratireductor sp. GISD-1A_MAKvit]|uniref:hypothetical protein n=1 Tax=Nitratireductor sp. GISD-1A_MAKvit TaxID=3234198 RepID=UPI003467B485
MSTAHNARTLGGVILERASDCLEAVQSGYSIQAVKFTLRKPEFMLSDLSNPSQLISLLSSEDIRLYHDLIREALEAESAELRSRIITGSGLKTEIALYGQDQESLQKEGQRVQERALKLFGLEKRLQVHNPFCSRGIAKSRSMDSLYSQTLSEYHKICGELAPYYIEEFRKYVSVFNLKTVYANHAVWQKIRDLGHNFVFILNSGLRFYLSMINSTGLFPAAFFEVHRQNDAYELFRRRDVDMIQTGELDRAKPTVIIDIAYTGGSILRAREMIEERLGPGAQIVTVGLFPKSFEAVNRLDYCVYAGRLIRLSERRYSPLDWHTELLLEDHDDKH